MKTTVLGDRTCKEYVGVTCINGNCPKALAEEHFERDLEAPKKCVECWHNRGCEDCMWDNDAQHCPKLEDNDAKQN